MSTSHMSPALAQRAQMLKENPDALKQKEPVSLKRPAEDELVNEVPRE